MGLFGKMFEKKQCSVCGGEIGLLGNRKLEDGNLCKNCAAKLSPWFSDRRNSSVEEIKAQLAYREENQQAVAAFHTTRSFGDDWKVLLDEDAKKFIVTRARNITDANPDVLDFAQVTGCDLNVDEDRDEEQREDANGSMVSYNPPRFTYSYDFEMIIRVNHPYFDEMRFELNGSSVEINPDHAVPASQKPDPMNNQDYREYMTMGQEIKAALTGARDQAREEARAAAAPKTSVTCPHCGATTMPDAAGCCEYCGGAL